jgi:hypothetical protein
MEITFEMVRELGIGNGFKVLDPHDGFRKDNRLWFGTCEVCGESVTNSSFDDAVWKHTVYTYKEYWSKDATFPNHSRSHDVAYCPTAEGKVVEPEIVRRDLI